MQTGHKFYSITAFCTSLNTSFEGIIGTCHILAANGAIFSQDGKNTEGEWIKITTFG